MTKIEAIIVQGHVKAKSDKQAKEKFEQHLREVYLIQNIKSSNFKLDEIEIEDDNGKEYSVRVAFCPAEL